MHMPLLLRRSFFWQPFWIYPCRLRQAHRWRNPKIKKLRAGTAMKMQMSGNKQNALPCFHRRNLRCTPYGKRADSPPRRSLLSKGCRAGTRSKRLSSLLTLPRQRQFHLLTARGSQGRDGRELDEVDLEARRCGHNCSVWCPFSHRCQTGFVFACKCIRRNHVQSRRG
jgi:hypothetical protein